MLESFFEASFTLDRLRSGPSGQYIDGFAEQLREDGYSRETVRCYLRSAAHVGWFMETEGKELSVATFGTLKAYSLHLDHCQCPHGYRGRRPEAIRGGKHFLGYLARIGVAKDWSDKGEAEELPLVASFRGWLVQHRGSRGSTLYRYCRGAGSLIAALGDDPGRYNATNLRTFILERARQSGPGAVKSLISAVRAFLRYLAAVGKCRVGLDGAIPSVAGWRLASQPQSLGKADVDRILRACDSQTVVGLRDHAVILLLARLGLRAGDVASLRFSDLSWDDASLVVAGKSRREVRLPLPQELGDALLEYIEHRPAVAIEQVFLRVLPPFRALPEVIPRSAMWAAVIAIAAQAGHFAEELMTGFHERVPAVFGLPPMSQRLFVSFNLAWLAICALSAWGLARLYQIALFPLWLLGIAGVVNGLLHPLLALNADGYFPGLATSPLMTVVGAMLLARLSRVTA